MRQLADRVILSKSGVTRLIDRLVLDGLVERRRLPASDARGAEAVLTAGGLDRLRRASRTHLRGIDEHFLAAVDQSDLPAIERLDAAPSPTTPARAAVTPPTDVAPVAGRGRLYVGTSGFAYPGWSPRFYPPGLKGDALLRHYASRLPAVELNNTFYQRRPTSKVATWVAATPADFRFSVKAQRGGSWRAHSAGARTRACPG